VNYLLDTCVISELVRPLPNEKVKAWVARNDENRLYLSVLTLGELKKGIWRLPDNAKRKKLISWLEYDVRQRFEGRIVDLNADVLLEWGRLTGVSEAAGRPLPVIDSLFVATAIHHRLAFVTRNSVDVQGLGVELIDPWVV
jgi:predicted nucleic acid-binding protein